MINAPVEMRTDGSPRTRLHGDAAQLAVRLRSIISKPRTVLLIGGVGGDSGAGEIAARLALALVSLDFPGKVLLIDADVRSAFVKRHFGLKSMKGLARAVSGGQNCLDAVDKASVPNLAILPALETDGLHSREILASVGTPLLSTLLDHYQLILVNGPESASSFEFAVWAAHADHVVLAAEKGARSSEIVEAKKVIEECGASLAGVVVTEHE